MMEKLPTNRSKSEASPAITVQVPFSLLLRLYRYLDKLESTGVSANQETVMRKALQAFLDAEGY
jgi:hypothetical protein